MSTDEIEIPDACAACGKAGGGLKKCTSCQQVKYCGRDCQASHWKEHKRACKKKAAELHDEALFRQPPPRGDCPICLLIFPADVNTVHYQPCCGQSVCDGCMFTTNIVERMQVCPFCRAAACQVSEAAAKTYSIEGYKKRVEANDTDAMAVLGSCYLEGKVGEARDPEKARELLERAGKLGNARANTFLAQMYDEGEGVARDMKKAKHYYEIAAMGGELGARYNLGLLEVESNNPSRAVKHFAIAARDGHDGAMKKVTAGRQFITDQEYKETLRAFVKVTKETKSEQRDKANEFKAYFAGDLNFASGEKMERANQWLRANGY